MGMKVPLCEAEGARSWKVVDFVVLSRAHADPMVYSGHSDLSDGSIWRSN